MFQKFFFYLDERFPQFSKLGTKRPMPSPHLFCGQPVSLPSPLIAKIDRFRKFFYEITSTSQWREEAFSSRPMPKPTNYESLLTAFDFHFMDDGNLRLIEINTNASLFLPFWLLYDVTKTPLPNEFRPEGFIGAFHETHKQFSGQPLKKIVIFDENPSEEGLYFEFLLNQEFFQQQGLECEVMGTKDLHRLRPEPGLLIYNRHTDFFLAHPNLSVLQQGYFQSQLCVSPHPMGYSTMAHKNLLSRLRQSFMNRDKDLAQWVPQQLELNESDKETLWAKRKSYFFKPVASFGSKGVYSGKGISRKKFEELWSQKYLAQERCPAGTILVPVDGEEKKMKFDLRFYVTPREILLAGARVYQGQTTNVRTPGGGLSPLSLSGHQTEK